MTVEAQRTAVFEEIGRVLHDVLVTQPRDVLLWVANETETTSLLQDAANDALDYIDPVQRSQNDGTSIAEAQRNIASGIALALVRLGKRGRDI